MWPIVLMKYLMNLGCTLSDRVATYCFLALSIIVIMKMYFILSVIHIRVRTWALLSLNEQCSPLGHFFHNSKLAVAEIALVLLFVVVIKT